MFAGGGRLEAAEAVTGGDADLVNSLLDKSLLRARQDDDGEPRTVDAADGARVRAGAAGASTASRSTSDGATPDWMAELAADAAPHLLRSHPGRVAAPAGAGGGQHPPGGDLVARQRRAGHRSSDRGHADRLLGCARPLPGGAGMARARAGDAARRGGGAPQPGAANRRADGDARRRRPARGEGGDRRVDRAGQAARRPCADVAGPEPAGRHRDSRGSIRRRRSSWESRRPRWPAASATTG